MKPREIVLNERERYGFENPLCWKIRVFRAEMRERLTGSLRWLIKRAGMEDEAENSEAP